jgi:FKBP-type peptidyl-prolyl cis-trans isomerase
VRINLRKLAPLLAVGLLLGGCATVQPAASESEAVCEPHESGTAVEQVAVTGEFGEQPEVVFPTPLSGTGVETAVISEGLGPAIVGNQRIRIHFAGYNAATGEEFQASEFGTEQTIPQDLRLGDLPDFCKALTGVKVGSRVAILLDAENAHGSAGVAGLGIEADQAVLFIFDVVAGYLPRANGEPRAPQAGFPTVVLAPSGQPGLQPLNSAAPTEFMRSVLLEGEGEPIEIGDTAVMHYTGWTWDGNQFDSSWDRSEPAEFQIATGGLIEGFVRGLEGVTVGSQVVIVIPPDLGYGDAAQGSIPPNSTLVFVVDVLGKVN